MEWGHTGSMRGLRRITHEKQNLQAGETAEGPRGDARQLVELLQGVERVRGGTWPVNWHVAESEGRGTGMYVVPRKRGTPDASRTRYSARSLVSPWKVPPGMLVNWLLACSGMERIEVGWGQ